MKTKLGTTRCGQTVFNWGQRTYVMGIINVSPDSFSGDGLTETEAAVEQARRFVAEGVDIVDVGGESTRPGTAAPVSVAEEVRRVIPAISRISQELDIPISVDTYHLETAREALDAGANMINDIWGLKRTPGLANLASQRNVPLIVMSNQRDRSCRYIVPEVIRDLRRAVNTALEAGVERDNIIVDPGIGFGKTLGQNLELVKRLNEIRVLQRPVLLGTSRKSMIGLVLGLPIEQRLEGTAASIAIGISKGIDMVRVHDVQAMVRVCRMSDAIIRKGWKTGQ